MSAHIYFDLDGTLTDPYDGITRCILYALDQLGFPHPSDEYLHGCIGPPLYDTFPELVGEDLTLEAIDLYRQRFAEVGWKENEPYEGVVETLEALAGMGHALFVATSKPHVHAKLIVEHFGMAPYIRAVYGCELDGTRANKVDLLAYAVAENPGIVRRIMIGDRKHDLLGAAANGMLSIGVAYGYGSIDELETAGAGAIAHSPVELPAIVRAQLSG